VIFFDVVVHLLIVDGVHFRVTLSFSDFFLFFFIFMILITYFSS
jgi:hypothetical protein